jgi:hypothetical protein
MSTTTFGRLTALAAALTASIFLAAAAAGEASGSKLLAQRFTLSGETIQGIDKTIRVVAAGPISGTGTVSAPNTASRLDRLTLHLAKGSVFLVVAEKTVAAHPDYRTCTAKINGDGTFTITGGTRAFQGARGSGTFSRQSTLIGGRGASGKCLGSNAVPKAVHTTSTLIGKAALPAA